MAAKVFVALFLLGLSVVVGYGRVFLGVCSIDEAVFGWTLGIWIAALFHFGLRKHMYKHADDLLKG